ncbi:alpha/beta hydrolase [Lentzea sp. HUAS12]|uniref:alpha/beta hydrolase n=1 Tax=Lentzea sp. HUAS12 TaxID=2951806 RepID=UPI0020A08112|nr:alpha/beta hydrolase [Lentzea sp. HUAS12]USX54683.1 alpha/beta hydrolase [Lentzea sp. HUAS12]
MNRSRRWPLGPSPRRQSSGASPSRSPVATWTRRLAAATSVGVPLALLATAWGPLTTGHPAHLLLLAAVIVIGTTAAVWRRVPPWLALALTVVLVAPLLYLQPFASTQDGDDATVLRPDGPVRAGLVFHPGARVDHRAYVPLLRRVAAQGFLVVVVKEPLNIALLGGDTAPLRAEHPEVPVWAVGGHSLGGVAAARDVAADPAVRGLVLWASYPVDDLSGRGGLRAWSIRGERDGFTTREDVEDSRGLLPADTRFEVVPGAVHAFFGDYGDQPGDGVPSASRDDAQEKIVELTAAALGDLAVHAANGGHGREP